MSGGQRYEGFVPGRHSIDAYGNGGFRFAGMSHRGSILALPSGVLAWPVAGVADLTRRGVRASFGRGRATSSCCSSGPGVDMVFLPPALLQRHSRGRHRRRRRCRPGPPHAPTTSCWPKNRQVAAALDRGRHERRRRMSEPAHGRAGRRLVDAVTAARPREPTRTASCATLVRAAQTSGPRCSRSTPSTHEIARVREIVSDPLPGEIRCQWWRDAADRAGAGRRPRPPRRRRAAATRSSATSCRGRRCST